MNTFHLSRKTITLHVTNFTDAFTRSDLNTEVRIGSKEQQQLVLTLVEPVKVQPEVLQ